MHRKQMKYCLMFILVITVTFSTIAAAAGSDSGYILYTVLDGDTLSEIAEKYHTSAETILKENGISEEAVAAGKVLKIPASKTGDNSGKSGITLEVRDADIRDVLSTLAVILKKNIIYTEESVRVSFSVQNVSAAKALEILTQSAGMTSITDGNLILVGSSANISQNFYTLLPITRFSLNYLSPEQINEQIDRLGIPVQNIILDSTKKYIWAQGTPQALAKMRELVAALDREENVDPVTQEPVKEFTLTPIDLKYVESGVINTLIAQLEIPCKTVVFETNPWTIWVEADASAMKDVLTLVSSVDIAENKAPEVAEEVTDTEGEKEDKDGKEDKGNKEDKEEAIVDTTRIEAKKMKNITWSRLLPLIQDLDIPVKIIAIDSSGYNLWMRGDQQSINLMNDLINRLDNYFTRDDVNFFIHKLDYLKASTAIEKLNFIGMKDVQAMSLNYPEFSREILIACPADRITDVKNVLKKLDVPGEKVRAIVDSSATSNGKSRLEARRDLIVQLTGISKESFQVSQNISKTYEPLYVLWVEESPDNIALIRDVISSMDAGLESPEKEADDD